MFQCLPLTLTKLTKSDNAFQVRNCHIFLYKYKFQTDLKFLLFAKTANVKLQFQ